MLPPEQLQLSIHLHSLFLLRSIWILSSFLYWFLLTILSAYCLANLPCPPWIDTLWGNWWRQQIMNFLFSCYLMPSFQLSSIYILPNQASWLKYWHFWFVFGTWPFQITARPWLFLLEAPGVFLSALRYMPWLCLLVPPVRLKLLLSKSFPVQYPFTILNC